MIGYRSDEAVPRGMTSDQLEAIVARVTTAVAATIPKPQATLPVNAIVDMVTDRVLKAMASAAGDKPVIDRAISRAQRRLAILTGTDEAARIIHLTGAIAKVNPSEIVGHRRKASIVNARHVAIGLCRERLGYLSFPQIGRLFGGRDHTTVMYAAKRVERERQKGGPVADLYYAVKTAVERLASPEVAA